jgi:hypothetical protein
VTTDQHSNLPDFEETEQAPSAPKRQRRKPQKTTTKKRRTPREVPKAAVPRRTRKKRVPRRLPGRMPVEIHANGAPPVVGPEAAGVIRAYMALDEAQRAVVFAYIQALR